MEELRYFLTKQFSAYVRDPQVFVSPAAYRPIRLYIGGEVARPGYYYLSGQQAAVEVEADSSAAQAGSMNLATGQVGRGTVIINPAAETGPRIGGVGSTAFAPAHRLRCSRTAGGVTPFSKLSEVSVTCKRPSAAAAAKCVPNSTFLS